MFAQVAPGNAASLRAFLAAGFRPIGQRGAVPYQLAVIPCWIAGCEGGSAGMTFEVHPVKKER